MELAADILLIAGGIGAGLYCFVLSRRLARFNNLENGMGGAVAVLSAQVDDLSQALEQARATAAETAEKLEKSTARAEEMARRLELHLAAGTEGLRGASGTASSGPARVVRRRRRTPDHEEAAA